MNELQEGAGISLEEELQEIEATFGRGEDTEGLIGRLVKVTTGEEPFYECGDIGIVAHVDANGDLWVDFDKPSVFTRRIWCIGREKYEVIA